jgi:hypothetical protein
VTPATPLSLLSLGCVDPWIKPACTIVTFLCPPFRFFCCSPSAVRRSQAAPFFLSPLAFPGPAARHCPVSLLPAPSAQHPPPATPIHHYRTTTPSPLSSTSTSTSTTTRQPPPLARSPARRPSLFALRPSPLPSIAAAGLAHLLCCTRLEYLPLAAAAGA